MMCGNASDIIDHPLPKHFVSAHQAFHHARAPDFPPSKSGAVSKVESQKRFGLSLPINYVEKIHQRHCRLKCRLNVIRKYFADFQ